MITESADIADEPPLFGNTERPAKLMWGTGGAPRLHPAVNYRDTRSLYSSRYENVPDGLGNSDVAINAPPIFQSRQPEWLSVYRKINAP
jgi:hypothetical protein